MGKTLYLECYSGISGDMTVAALLDLEADRSVLDRVLKSLKVSGFETKISRVVKSGIDACDFDVVLDKEHENHDHDMEYLHGHHHKGHENNHFTIIIMLMRMKRNIFIVMSTITPMAQDQRKIVTITNTVE